MLAFDLYRNSLTTYGSGGHPQNLAPTVPVLVLDMYEHAFQMDYGAAAASYIDAFFTNVNYDVVAHRLAAARKAGAALHG